MFGGFFLDGVGTGLDALLLVFILFFLEPFLGRFEAVGARWGEFSVRVGVDTSCWGETWDYYMLPHSERDDKKKGQLAEKK